MVNDDKNLSHFGGKDKTRGAKHRKDKEKYRPKSAKETKIVARKSKPNLGSNWDRYEKEDESQTFRLTSSTDFAILANAPITQGQHFQFKQDKLIAEEAVKTPQELFSVDLNMLQHSILTVPFYKRLGIDKKYFTENQLCYMKQNAETSLIKYNEKYSNKTICEDHTQELCSNKNNDGIDQSESTDIPDLNNISLMENETDSEIKVANKMEGVVKPKTNQGMEQPNEDLEQWLDDILDQ